MFNPPTNISLLSSKWIIKYGRRFVTRSTSTMFFNIDYVDSLLQGSAVEHLTDYLFPCVCGVLRQGWVDTVTLGLSSRCGGGSIWDRRHSAVIPFVFKPTRSSQKKKVKCLLSGYLRSIKKKAKTIRRVGISVYLPTRLARDDTSLTPWPDTIKLKSLVLTLPFYFLSQTDIANVSFFVVSKRWNYQTIFEREKRNFSAAVGFFEPIRDKRDGYYWLLSSWRVYV